MPTWEPVGSNDLHARQDGYYLRVNDLGDCWSWVIRDADMRVLDESGHSTPFKAAFQAQADCERAFDDLTYQPHWPFK